MKTALAAVIASTLALFACSGAPPGEPAPDGTYSGRSDPGWAPENRPCPSGTAPADAFDGWVRCLPSDAFPLHAFADDACTAPLAAARDGAAAVVIDGHVYQLGARADGPAFAMHPTCDEVPVEAIREQVGELGYDVVAVGGELPITQFRVR